MSVDLSVSSTLMPQSNAGKQVWINSKSKTNRNCYCNSNIEAYMRKQRDEERKEINERKKNTRRANLSPSSGI